MQCKHVWRTERGKTWIDYRCQLDDDHAGDHRALGHQWYEDELGLHRVTPTIELPEARRKRQARIEAVKRLIAERRATHKAAEERARALRAFADKFGEDALEEARALFCEEW